MAEKMTWDNTVLFGCNALIAETDTISLRQQAWTYRISRDQHIQTCQAKTTNVKIHAAVPKVYTYLISFAQMEMANASGNFGHALLGLWELGMMQSTTSAVFWGIWKNAVFSGHGSRMTVRRNPGCLAGWLAVWLGWLSGYLAIWLAGWLSSWLAIWLPRWLAGYLAIGCVAAWLAIWLLAIWLVGWLADWHWLFGSLNGSRAGWLIVWWFAR